MFGNVAAVERPVGSKLQLTPFSASKAMEGEHPSISKELVKLERSLVRTQNTQDIAVHSVPTALEIRKAFRTGLDVRAGNLWERNAGVIAWPEAVLLQQSLAPTGW